MKNGSPLVWNGIPVGTVHNPTVDMWFVYGRWYPEASRHTQDFLEAVRQAELSDSFIEVEFEGSPAFVFGSPEDFIEVRTV